MPHINAMQKISVRLDDRQVTILDNIADKRSINRSEMMRKVLNAGLQEFKELTATELEWLNTRQQQHKDEMLKDITTWKIKKRTFMSYVENEMLPKLLMNADDKQAVIEILESTKQTARLREPDGKEGLYVDQIDNIIEDIQANRTGKYKRYEEMIGVDTQ